MHHMRSKYIPYLKGNGLEIGALEMPQRVAANSSVQYSDILTPEQIDRLYPGAKHPDIQSNGEVFPDIADDTYDFIIANHVLEHLSDPISALIEWHRIARAGAKIMLTLPDKRKIFDKTRPRTTLDHLRADFYSNEDPKYRDFEHLKEWASHVEGLEVNSINWKRWIDEQFAQGYSVHNHVWILEDILELIDCLRSEFNTNLKILDYNDTAPRDIEFTLLLQVVKAPLSRSEAISQKLHFTYTSAKQKTVSFLKKTKHHCLRETPFQRYKNQKAYKYLQSLTAPHVKNPYYQREIEQEDLSVVFLSPFYRSYPVLISSLIEQDYSNWKLLLVHDGPLADFTSEAEVLLQHPNVELVSTEYRANDWGHTPRQRGFEILSARPRGDFLVVTNSDNYYVPGFLRTMLSAFNESTQFAYCDMVHDYYHWRNIPTKLEYSKVDCGCLMARTDLALGVGWNHNTYEADWQYVHQLLNRCSTKSIEKIPAPLFVHN